MHISRPLPFYDPQGELIDLKNGARWTTTDALAGTLVTGSIGSGKSSGPGAMLLRAFLRSTTSLPGGMGGMFFIAKNGHADEIEDVCRRTGRGEDVIRITPGGRYQFNFLDWISAWGDGASGPIPTVALLEEVATALDPASAGAGAGENAFFEGAHRAKLSSLVHIIQLSGLPVGLPLMEAISNSAPQSLAQSKDPTWREHSACWAILREAEAMTRDNPAARADFEICRSYFLHQYPSLSDRTRGVVEIMFSALTRPFLTRPLRQMFCEGSNIRPELMFEGKLLIVDCPIQEWHQTGKLAALAFKRTAQLAIMRRSGPPGSLRPVVLHADEAQACFLSACDTEYQSVARSSGGVTCLLSQQISSLREALGSEDKAENLISNLQTKIGCQCSGETSRFLSELVGEHYTQITGLNIGGSTPENEAQGAGPSTSGGINRSEQKRAYIEPSAFQKLRRGGAANDYKVDAVVFVGGKMFAGDGSKEPQPYKILSFNQR